jgi:hypothetical protein
VFAAHANSQMLASAIEHRLTSFAEVTELSEKIVNVKIAMRKRGTLPLIAAPAKKAGPSA